MNKFGFSSQDDKLKIMASEKTIKEEFANIAAHASITANVAQTDLAAGSDELRRPHGMPADMIASRLGAALADEHPQAQALVQLASLQQPDPQALEQHVLVKQPDPQALDIQASKQHPGLEAAAS